jgi:hypothetical protein
VTIESRSTRRSPMQHRIISLTVAALAAVGVAGGAYASHAMGLKMGPSATTRRPSFRGYYDGHKDTYLNTDVSDNGLLVTTACQRPRRRGVDEC